MAQTLHGARHPRYWGATVPPHHQAGLRCTPDAADLGAKEAVQSGSACRPGREIWARASVHARRSNHKAHTETWLLVAQQLLVLYCVKEFSILMDTRSGIYSVFSETLSILDELGDSYFTFHTVCGASDMINLAFVIDQLNLQYCFEQHFQNGLHFVSFVLAFIIQ